MKKFETVTEITAHLAEIKTKMDAFKAENPNVSFSSYVISDIHPDLIQELAKNEKRAIEYNDTCNRLFLSSYGTYGLDAFFTSLKVAKVAPVITDYQILELETA